MNTLSIYSGKELLNMLVALLELQILAVNAKRFNDPEVAFAGTGVYVIFGICRALEHIHIEKDDYSLSLLTPLFVNAPCNTYGRIAYPVPSHDSRDNSYYYSEGAHLMWGDHPYADNRRQLITEMIEQLHVELTNRGYDL